MASPAQQLPPGWAVEWYAPIDHAEFRHSNALSSQGTDPSTLPIHRQVVCSYSRRKIQNLQTSTEQATGHTQWEPPVAGNSPVMDADAPVAPISSTKRRQYAAGQTQAYYSAEGGGIADQGYGSVPPAAQQQQGGGQYFTPGLTQSAQFQPAAPGYAAGPDYAAPADLQGQPGPYGQPQYGATPGYPNPNVNALADQFGQMGVGGAQKQFQLSTTNLFTSPPEPSDLHLPPPEIRLPPNSCVTPSPTANADPSYQRSTLNAIPTTHALLGKSKLPLALVITPYRSLNEGEEPVPLVTDTVIARCRRCRTYMNPYVQFIDGGNRCVFNRLAEIIFLMKSL